MACSALAAVCLVVATTVWAQSRIGDGRTQAATSASERTAFAPLALTPLPSPTPLTYPAGSSGYAISWPQCGATYPAEPFGFGIVGVTDGAAFTHNP